MSTLINFGSPAGKRLLEECLAGKGGSVFQPIVQRVFNKQVKPASCGIQSCAIILSAQQLAKTFSPEDKDVSPIPKSEQPITEETMFDYEGTTKAVSIDQIYSSSKGMTLQQVSDVLKGHGKTVETVFASDADVNRFRSDAKKALSAADHSSGVIVNYHMGTLGQGPVYGHHSPLAGYHAERDRFLIMDTWYETQECWASAETLFDAMNVVDSDSGKTRGYCIIKA